MTRITALIVDDEPHAREKIRRHLQSDSSVTVIGECGDGPSAVEAAHSLKPDLIFLDVQMPGSDGFSVLESISADPMPLIVFVTAFDKYAVRAFEVHALDYLLKPFDSERFHNAMNRVHRRIVHERSDTERRLIDLKEEVQSGAGPTSGYLERLVVRTRGRIIFLRTDEISWIETASNYVRLHAGEESHLMRATMTALESRLNPEEFIRVHRSFIVRIDEIRRMEPFSHGEYVITLKSGTQLTSSRSCRSQIRALIGRR